MILKRLIFVGLVSLLTACSSGSNSGDDEGSTSGGGTTGGDVSGNGGIWTGDIGYGSGVYVVDANNNVYGLSSDDGSTYTSSFGNIGNGTTYSGSLVEYFHPASNAVSGIAMAPIGEEFAGSGTPLNLNIVAGQTIENLASGNEFTLTNSPSSLTTATPSAVAGSWRGTHSFLTGDNSYAEYRMDVTFSGNTMTGSTGVYSFGGDNDGAIDFVHDVNGTIAGYSNALTTNFTWSDAGGTTTYNGVIYFHPDGSGNLVVNVQAANGGSPVTLNSVLQRL
ncbi:MAG: hypothetical protein KTR35_20315 [Gammaproteobacteria bacterium]|nr:hypothetical protein [Gammaproteobacteria bacterium]